jgi:two-component system, response regulator / RNA-binding antiterminator
MGAFLKDLRGLKVHVIAPLDKEGQLLTSQLRRFGCSVTTHWPLPDRLPQLADVVFLSINDDDMQGVNKFLEGIGSSPPTLIAIVGYENPATLQVVLENNFSAIVERPLRSFGLLANLVVARNLWLQQQHTVKELRNYKRRALGDQKVVRAKAVLMAARGLDEQEAYRELRSRAQSTRLPIEAVADAVLEEERRVEKKPSEKSPEG